MPVKSAVSGAIVLGWWACIAQGASTGSPALPSASVVFDHYVQATGGRSAWQSKQMERDDIEGRTLDGSRVILQASVTTTRNGNSRTDMSIPEVASEGVFRGLAWSWTKLAGPRIRKGTERQTALRATHMLEESDWRSLYPNSRVDGAEPVGGKLITAYRCCRRRMAAWSGSTWIRAF